MKSKAKPALVKPERLSVSFRINPILIRKPVPFDEIETDLLVVDLHEHMHAGAGLSDLDTALGGIIKRALEQHDFEGVAGDSLLIETLDKKIKRVLVVGVGKADSASRFTFCAFTRVVFENARRLGVERVTIPIFSGRLNEIGLTGTAAILRCRTEQFSNHLGGLGNLKEIEILSTPQARRWIVDGLTVANPLCRSCSDPQLLRLKR